MESQLVAQVQAQFKKIEGATLRRYRRNEDHFSLHGANAKSNDHWLEDMKSNHQLALPFKVAFGLVFAGYESFVIEMSGTDNVEDWFQGTFEFRRKNSIWVNTFWFKRALESS